MKVLAVGSHFDDIEIGCAGTLIKHLQNGDEVYYAITHTDEYRTGPIIDRLHEQDLAIKEMGISSESRYLFLFEETNTDAEIITALDQLHADIIFAPYEYDTHQHHRRTSFIGQSVGRKRYMTVLFYDSGSTINFTPNIFSVINFERKLKILNCYKSQIEYGAIHLDIVEKKNEYWGTMLGNDNCYAEGFISRKLIYKI